MCIFFTIDNNIYDFTVSDWERVNRNRRIWQVSILCEFGKPMLQTLGAGGSLANHVMFTVTSFVYGSLGSYEYGTGGSILRYDHFLCGKRIFTSRPRASRSAGWWRLLCVLRVCLYKWMNEWNFIVTPLRQQAMVDPWDTIANYRS